MSITVYTKKPCPQCDATKRSLTKNGLEYTELDLLAPENAEALEAFKAQGFTSAPIVVAGDEVWSGFRTDKIKAIAQKVAVVA